MAHEAEEEPLIGSYDLLRAAFVRAMVEEARASVALDGETQVIGTSTEPRKAP